jgi:hypothetical protein
MSELNEKIAAFRRSYSQNSRVMWYEKKIKHETDEILFCIEHSLFDAAHKKIEAIKVMRQTINVLKK